MGIYMVLLLLQLVVHGYVVELDYIEAWHAIYNFTVGWLLLLI